MELPELLPLHSSSYLADHLPYQVNHLQAGNHKVEFLCHLR